MYSFNNFLLMKLLLKFNLYYLIFTLLLLIIILIFSKISNYQSFFKNVYVFSYIKFFLKISLVVSFFLHFIVFLLYINISNYYTNYIIFNDYILLPNQIILNDLFNISLFNSNLYFTLDIFGLVLLTLAYLVGFIALLALDTRLYWKNINYIFAFNLFLIIVYVYVTTTNIILFFLFYELLLLPSFLLVYFVSPSRRAIQASLYFVIWTQVGSIFVLIAVMFITIKSNIFDFFLIKSYNFKTYEIIIILNLLFFGFGFKVPIWPFHYWLTKTHVEAPSGFSIYLSGFLVKSALYGFYKLTNLFNVDYNTSLFIGIAILGVVDSSLKMWGQTDLKKLVAYGTVQEMNLIFLTFLIGDSVSIISGILFSATHAFLSALMFFLVDCLYRRYHTRSIVELNGILHLTPNLAISIVLMLIFFAGLPGTIKFISEFYIFSGFLELSPILCFILMFIANVIGLVGFSKAWFNVIFGMTRKYKYMVITDLSYKELYIIFYCLIFLFFFSYFSSFLF